MPPSPPTSRPPKPTLGLLRSLTDDHVLQALLERPRMTRAELAAHTGISKPTVAESVRRLTAAGLVRDTGQRSTGRGRSGSYFALADDLGWALAVSVTPSAIAAERIGLRGEVAARADEPIPPAPGADRVAAALVAAVERVIIPGAPVLAATVSAADPVDRHTGRLVELPDSPFLVGALDPSAVLAPLVDGPVSVDNDVNWAARAELARPDCPADFVLLYLGAGLGSAVVSDGAVRRGHGGVAGEVAHVVTAGPDGRAMHFTAVFAELGLHRPGSAAIDVPALLGRLDRAAGDGRHDDGVDENRTLHVISRAVCQVLVSLISITDPELIMIAGPWGGHPALLPAVQRLLDEQPRRATVVGSQLPPDAPLAAARKQAVTELRRVVLARG